MISVEEAKRLIKEHVKALSPVQVDLENACRHVLAESIYASCDIPAFNQSSMDGYAFIFEEGKQLYQLIGEMAAGTTHSIHISRGETSRIFTGAPLPQGANTVIMQEKTEKSSEQITFNDERLVLGANVREKGSEIKAGTLAMEQGNLLTPPAIGFLAGIGVKNIKVFPMPKVCIIVTGNELQTPGEPLQFGQVYESNSYSLKAALKQESVTTIEIIKVSDDLTELTNVLTIALINNDVILLTGGISVGDYDFVLEATQLCEVHQIFHKVKQKPGKPLFFGTKENKLVFGLPGNPASVLSCYYNYVLPSIKYLTKKEINNIEIEAILNHDYKKPAGLTHFLKGIYSKGRVSVLKAQESYRLSSFAHANCLIKLEEEVQEVKAGDTVNILLLPN